MLADLKSKSCASLDKRRGGQKSSALGDARRLPGGRPAQFRQSTPKIPQQVGPHQYAIGGAPTCIYCGRSFEELVSADYETIEGPVWKLPLRRTSTRITNRLPARTVWPPGLTRLLQLRRRTGDGKHGGHDRHAGHSVAMFRDRFWITLLLTVPTLVWSDMIQGWLGFRAPEFAGSAHMPAIFGAAVYLYGGWVFLAGGVRELRDRLPGMMTLISLAISVAFFFSVAVALGYPGEPRWWELATLVTIMLLGHWIEMRSIFQASGALRELAKLMPSTAQRIVGERIEDVPVSALSVGDLVLVRPGASVPADGVVRSGRSDVNESMITGESVPVQKTEGAKVIAGTVNGAGSLRIEVTGTGERTALANIMRLVEQAQTSRSRAQALADRAAFLLTLVAIAAGVVTLVVGTALGAPGAFAVERVVSVLVVACPHALGLAVRHCQVDEVSAWLPSRLDARVRSATARHRIPLPECFPSQQTVVGRPEEMSAHPEEILYKAVHRGEALHLGGRLEAPHLALALARRLMGDFSSIVRVLVRDVNHARHHSPTSRRIAPQLVRDETSRWRSLAFQQFPEEARGGAPIAPGLHEDVDHVAVLVDGPQRYCCRPWIVMNSSSRYHISPMCPRWRRSVRAYAGPKVRHHCRIVS
jgi:E1-E2 ATPase